MGVTGFADESSAQQLAKLANEESGGICTIEVRELTDFEGAREANILITPESSFASKPDNMHILAESSIESSTGAPKVIISANRVEQRRGSKAKAPPAAVN